MVNKIAIIKNGNLIEYKSAKQPVTGSKIRIERAITNENMESTVAL